jgi:hypothetical protein
MILLKGVHDVKHFCVKVSFVIRLHSKRCSYTRRRIDSPLSKKQSIQSAHRWVNSLRKPLFNLAFALPVLPIS